MKQRQNEYFLFILRSAFLVLHWPYVVTTLTNDAMKECSDRWMGRGVSLVAAMPVK
jgi:hypothetical protein